jgi:hypothetical protein
MIGGSAERLLLNAAEQGANATKGQRLSAEQVERRRRTARQLNLARHLPTGHRNLWTAKQLALIGTMPDTDVAAKTGRTVNAVRIKQANVKTQ